MASSTSTSLSATVANAIAFLTRPLIISYPATTIIKLQLVLEANLTALYAPHWVPQEPLRGSGRRSMTLSPSCLPPRPIYAACLAAGVQWFDWIALLGGREFDLFVDPGCVSIRFAKGADGEKQFHTVWADELPSPVAVRGSTSGCSMDAFATAQRKTLAQQLLEEDVEEDEQLFAMIADELNAPTWMTPILDQFPAPTRSSSPLSTISAHSRSSSRSSTSSSGFSFISGGSSVTSVSSSPSSKSDGEKVAFKQSRRERARQARVFVDITKTEVTPYDGGKTTVLTGGVMLGGGRSKAKVAAPQPPNSDNWRAARA